MFGEETYEAAKELEKVAFRLNGMADDLDAGKTVSANDLRRLAGRLDAQAKVLKEEGDDE